jgi:16S rRNA (cytosine1402-N4)-methyltransferase
VDTAWKHTTVLLNEAVDALFTNPDALDDSSAANQTYVDATYGRGGHSD